MAARLLGAWAKRILSLAVVWGWGWCGLGLAALGRTCLAGLLCPPLAWLCVRGFPLGFEGPVPAGSRGGSEAERGAAPTAGEERARRRERRVWRGWVGKGIRRRDAGVPGRPLGPDEREGRGVGRANNVTLPAGEQRKDVYVQLYLQHLTARNRPPLATSANSKGPPDFSSDEEREPTPVLGFRGRRRGPQPRRRRQW